VLCISAAIAVAIGQLQLQLTHYSLVALQAFASRNVISEGALRGPRKNFSRLAIARHIFRPPHKLCYNSTTVDNTRFWPEVCMNWRGIGSCAACFRRPLSSVDVSVCLCVCVPPALMLNISETKWFRGTCPIGPCRKVPTARRLWRHRWRHVTLWYNNRDATIFKVVAFWN